MLAAMAGCNEVNGASDLAARGTAQPTPRVEPPATTAGTDLQAPVGDAGVVPAGASGANDAGLRVVPARPTGGKFVFVTSTTGTGNLGGVAGADGRCVTLAKAAGLGGNWAAWLSTFPSVNAGERVGGGPWFLVNGTPVAASPIDLTIHALSHALDHDENGKTVGADFVWTGTLAGRGTSVDCAAWSVDVGRERGDVGNSSLSDREWSQSDTNDCSSLRHLYCFEL